MRSQADAAPRPPQPAFRRLTRRGERLGDILVGSGAVDRGRLRLALSSKHVSKAPLGQVLLSHGFVDEADLARALARQWGLGVVDLTASPPSPDCLTEMNAGACLRHLCLPWRRWNGRTILLVSDPASAAEAARAAGLDGARVAVAIGYPAQIRAFIEEHFGGELEEDARLQSPPDMNCRNWQRRRAAGALAGAILAMVALAVLAPLAAFWLCFAVALTANLTTTLVRVAALVASGLPRRAGDPSGSNVVRLSDHRDMPVISILVPLYREERVLPSLLANIAALDYPPELLDVKIVIEARDTVTAGALSRMVLPAHVDVVTVPDHKLKTKPRAMNYAINFCRGSIVGILDAEDRPEPDQLRKVVHSLHSAPPDVACVQGRLDFYNPCHNWLSRCFTIEYGVWFSLLLRGTRRLGLPIPLGGTTVYFRRKHLEDVSGWDAHNVTEDADLGIRLFRFGYRAEYIDTTTWEEANSRPVPWIRQRSRWLKGYMMTWAVHARNPIRLMQDLGPVSGLYVHILLLGGIVSYLSIPVFWIVLAGTFGVDLVAWLGGPGWLWTGAFASMLAGQAVMLGAAFAAAAERGKRHLLPWVPTLLFYWPLGALAGFKALLEMIYAPHYWDKTEHGAYSVADTVNQTSPSGPMEMPSLVGASTG